MNIFAGGYINRHVWYTFRTMGYFC